MPDCIVAEVPWHLIQGVRLAHALMESDYLIGIPSEHADKFSVLTEVFGIEFGQATDASVKLPSVEMVHSTPHTAVGSISRPLIFPHAVVERCRALWASERTVRFSFAGLVTQQRKRALETWIRRALPGSSTEISVSADAGLGTMRRVLNVLRGRRSVASCNVVRSGDLILWSSSRGRRFPGKAWDEEYFRLLGRSAFVLCPNGDYVWSYRFFEATLCGAIPIVEGLCDAYEGYRFMTMEDPVRDVAWSATDAEHNFRMSVERLTVPIESLNTEIARLTGIVPGVRARG